MYKKRVLLLAFLVSIFCLTNACKSDVNAEDEKAEAETEEPKDERVPVELAALERGTIEAVVRSSANLEAEQQVQVFARASNRSVELLVEEGERVKKGQLLLRLEDDEQKIQLAQAQARVNKAKREFKRTNDLYKKELVTSQEYNNADYELEQAGLELQTAEQNLRYTRIEAPISGTITQRMVNLGDMVQPGTALFEITDFDSIVARVYLPEKNLALLELNQRARISAKSMEDLEYEGKIIRIAPTVDARTGTVKVTVGMDDIGKMRPGMYVDVSLVLATHEEVVLIPKRALVYDNDQVFVFRHKEENGEDLVERVLVDVLLTDRDHVEPKGGVEAGQKIVIAGHTGLKEGSKIRVLGEEVPGADLGATSATAEVTE
ncbi:MAG: efflux RND transporter periplasmic adaptor subunit [Acidobacteriota bacterium]|nr:efflux RND transporter periplasmic adaptor subunit [Acidobacteriota bacterium]